MSPRWAWILNLNRVLGLPALVAFTTGSFALQMEQLSDAAVAAELLEVLRRMYPGKVGGWPRTPYVTAVIHSMDAQGGFKLEPMRQS